VLLGFESDRASGVLTEREEGAYTVAELGQRLVVAWFKVFGLHRVAATSFYIVLRYSIDKNTWIVVGLSIC
jgi:hypothetical protein